ncbi:hypothetical protein F4779DRAFT_637653 [Xylariaceae sp. FL0662B]|nr:hypothetical protein F4779DRAFT_637653 [Xylariaceae sp. FL0662B]
MERSASVKRKAPLSNLQRRVRARKEEPELDSDQIFSDGSQEEEGHSEDSSSEESNEDNFDESDPSSEDEEEDVDPSLAASQVSFGALAKAQATLLPSTRRKKGSRKQEESDEDSEADDDDDDNAQSAAKPKTQPKPPHRTSKHAPTEQSSKRAVSRKRAVVAEPPRAAPRDPRFSAAVARQSADAARARKAYGFLDEYREAEMEQLRATLKQKQKTKQKTKTKGAGGEDAEAEELKRALMSMQSRKQAQARRDEEKAVVERHRRREKELVRQGKRPFYLKKSERRKQVLLDRFAGMKGREVDRAIERKRKKLTAKERREMPVARRETTTTR